MLIIDASNISNEFIHGYLKIKNINEITEDTVEKTSQKIKMHPNPILKGISEYNLTRLYKFRKNQNKQLLDD